MSLVLATAWKDLLQRVRDPFGLLLWLLIPLAIGFMLRLAFGGDDGGRPRARVLVVDRDDTLLSRLLIGALSQQQGSRLPFDAEAVELEQGRARIEDGDASALLVLPEGFARALLREEPCTLELVTNPAQRVLPGMVQESLEVLLDLVFYAHRVLGEPLRAIAAEPPAGRATLESAEVARISIEINELVERVSSLAFPPVIQLAVATDEQEEDGVDFGTLFFPSMLFMTIFFLAQGLSEDLWIEKQSGTLRRVLAAPHRPGAFLAGKALAGVLLLALVGAAGVVLGRVAFGLSLEGLPLAVLWTAASGLMLVLALYLLQMLATSQRGGNLLVTLVVMPLLMLGGSFFPFEAMPKGMAAIGRLTPNGWALVQLKAILAGRAQPGELAVALLVVLAVCAVLFALCARRMSGGFAR